MVVIRDLRSQHFLVAASGHEQKNIPLVCSPAAAPLTSNETDSSKTNDRTSCCQVENQNQDFLVKTRATTTATTTTIRVAPTARHCMPTSSVVILRYFCPSTCQPVSGVPTLDSRHFRPTIHVVLYIYIVYLASTADAGCFSYLLAGRVTQHLLLHVDTWKINSVL